MNKIDCGFLNEKCLNRVLKGVRYSDVNMIQVNILKTVSKMSLVLIFRTEEDKERWDKQSGKLVKDLKKLWRKK